MSASTTPDYTGDGSDTVTITLDSGRTCEIERRHLDILIERGNPAAWIAEQIRDLGE